MPDTKLLRLDRILASLGYGTRHTVQPLLRAGLVTVAGEEVRDGGYKTVPEAVRLDGEPLDHPAGILVMLHKPAGYACSHNPAEMPLVYELVPERWLRRNPPPTTVGRLDRDTTGLILVTDNLELVHRLTSPKHGVEKTYEVTVDTPIPEELIGLFASGEYLLEGETEPCRPARLTITDPYHAELVLHEGRFHQVKRMFGNRGIGVTALHRSRFGPYSLEDLAPGCWIDVPPPGAPP
jgi:16S rRNA pseudouridine516 synthase